ncbi:MAG: c-type cytochrome [Candidatus Thiodiazotropha lotti]|uniref:Cytochrome C n=1 Tax=Candidatus Thiodiazotropha endoloripes TaxID=1818881 RepID=A0A1E2UL48_9GAMM|nr:c-type cytochrome [Candidatus Thiodiazotropha endoloripes]MCG7899442.1 c-type cytochrome [Candidatus Thiodiazotropha weberae]MCG7992127.1 c-type cytochrome [Candidatus Thiodiazotropha lotti]MCG7903954.1 c-type cytochrome [Candidatus Thiodiazotropha weberae]MCG7915537.1 c-type cytochrome [Candidatus Thiodiazotropha weberae]MCG7998632.1 c-type cytochrome [Candidatus Thiodiazotropha lotti]
MQLTKQLILTMILLPASSFAIDLENGEEINEVCAGCHGEYGQGGKEGEYPRLAGMPSAFLARQLHLFRDRQRPNLAMVEYVDHRQMPDEDIRDISHFLSQIVLKTKLPPVDETSEDFNAYERLLASKRLMQIPRAPGDIEKGKKQYRKECASCHGRDGMGDMEKAVPMLAGQYTSYLWRQVKKYRNGIRIHDEEAPDDELLAEFTDQELTDMFAYLSILDD